FRTAESARGAKPRFRSRWSRPASRTRPRKRSRAKHAAAARDARTAFRAGAASTRDSRECRALRAPRAAAGLAGQRSWDESRHGCHRPLVGADAGTPHFEPPTGVAPAGSGFHTQGQGEHPQPRALGLEPHFTIARQYAEKHANRSGPLEEQI